jgi:hypothetical protein
MLQPFNITTHKEISDFCDRLRSPLDLSYFVQNRLVHAYLHQSGYVLVSYTVFHQTRTATCTEIIDARTIHELNIVQGFLVSVYHESYDREQIDNFLQLARQEVNYNVDEWIAANPFTK